MIQMTKSCVRLPSVGSHNDTTNAILLCCVSPVCFVLTCVFFLQQRITAMTEGPITWEKVQVPTETTRHCGPNPATTRRAPICRLAKDGGPWPLPCRSPWESFGASGTWSPLPTLTGIQDQMLTDLDSWKVKEAWNIYRHEGTVRFLGRGSAQAATGATLSAILSDILIWILMF